MTSSSKVSIISSLIYGGLQVIMSYNLPSYSASNISPVRNIHLEYTELICALLIAVLIALSLMSVIVTSAFGNSCARDIPIAPLPVHTSAITGALIFFPLIRPMVCSTKISVSSLGIKTSLFTLIRCPINPCTFIMY